MLALGKLSSLSCIQNRLLLLSCATSFPLIRPGLIRSSSRTAVVVCSAQIPRSSGSWRDDEQLKGQVKRFRQSYATPSSNKAQRAGADSHNQPSSSSEQTAGRKRDGVAADSIEAADRRDKETSWSSANEDRSSRGQQAGSGGRGGTGGRGQQMGHGGTGGRGGVGSRGGGRHGKSRSHDAVPPQVLTSFLKSATIPEQLLRLVQQHAGSFNHIHLSAAYIQAVKVCRSGVPPQHQPAAVQQLLTQLHQLAEQLQQQCGARGLANIIWSCGRLSTADTATMLLPVFLQGSNLQQAKPQEVSNVVLAAATLQLQLEPEHWQQLLQAFDRILDSANSQDVSNTVWATAAMGRTVPKPQLQRCLQHFQRVLPDATPQAVSNTLWAVATMGSSLQEAQLQQLLRHFTGVLLQANSQQVSNTLWAVATMPQQLPPAQLQQLLRHFTGVLPQANSQEVSNTLWAVATMGSSLQEAQLQQWLQHFQRVLPEASPQAVSNTLWAVATMGSSLQEAQLQQWLRHFRGVLSQANSQNVSNTLWACGKLLYAPLQLLSALEQQPQQLQALLAAANQQQLANMAWACGQLGYRDKLLPAALLQQAVKLLQGEGVSAFVMQGLCNLCWSAAVLNMQQHVPPMLQLVAATKKSWRNAAPEGLQQLYQVHLWLLDSQLPAPGQGLSGVLSQQQLEQCRASWEQQLQDSRQERSSDLERSVFAAVLLLPQDLWQQQPAAAHVTSDGAISIDIAATTASGVKVAIEVDGPTHFVQPGNTLEGGTLYRNRALAARGYVVVSIPHWEWRALKGAEQQQKYLLAKLAKL